MTQDVQAELAHWKRQAADMLTANNAYLERARKAETVASAVAQYLNEHPGSYDAGDVLTAENVAIYLGDISTAKIAAAQAEISALREVLPGIYVASKACHFEMWRTYRAHGEPIISTWIDEGADKATQDFPDLWMRCVSESAKASAVILYRETGEVLKGALLEIGAAMACGRPVFAVGSFDGTYHNHPLFHACATLEDAFHRARAALAGEK